MSDSQHGNQTCDLRTLSVEELNNILLAMGIEPNTIRKMNRWEKVNTIRNYFTQQNTESHQNQDTH